MADSAVECELGGSHMRFTVMGRRNVPSGAISPSNPALAVFDPDYYRNAYPDVAASGQDPWRHYCAFGAAERRNPCALFDVAWYLGANPHLGVTGADPVAHYLQHGGFEGRDPHPLFSSTWVAEHLWGSDSAVVTPLAGYMQLEPGRRPGPHPLFDVAWYAERNPDRGGVDPATHFIVRGGAEGLDPHPLFDSAFYLERNADVRRSGAIPLVNFLEMGWREGRDPNPYFDTSWYLATYVDVAEAGVNPLVHFQVAGELETRNPSRAFDSHQYIRAYLAPDSDEIPTGLRPLRHFLTIGQEAGNLPIEVYPARLPVSVPTQPWPSIWGGAVLLVFDMEIQQCLRYRVAQKLELGQLVGVPVERCRLRDFRKTLSRLQFARMVVLYRLPWSPKVEKLVEQAHRLGVPVVYETDDLVFSRDDVAANPNLATLPESVLEGLFTGADLMRRALRLADHVLASTEPLASVMAREVSGNSYVIENGIDNKMVVVGSAIDTERQRGLLRPDDGVVTISYGSGSRAHDADLQVASSALTRLMDIHPEVRLDLIGPLALGDLDRYRDRIRRFQEMPVGEYLRCLAGADIAIAPLQDAPFNVHKSQVKYLEAGYLGVPFVGSRTVYGRYVQSGVTGLIAADESDWFDCLQELVEDVAARATLAEAARTHVATWELSQRPLRQFEGFVGQVSGEAVTA